MFGTLGRMARLGLRTLGRRAALFVLLLGGLGLGQARDAQAQGAKNGITKSALEAQKMAEAQKHMDAGALLYNDPKGPKCEEAYLEFKKAHELSGSVKALRAMGICAQELERDGLAIEHFEMCLALAEKGAKLSAEEKAQIEGDLKSLVTAAASVNLSADRQGVRVSDVRTPAKGPAISNDYDLSGPALSERVLKIHPGKHRFTAVAPGGASLVWDADLENGLSYSHKFDFAALEKKLETPKPADERPVPISAIAVGGVSAALLVPTVILMVRAWGKGQDYKESNGKLPAAQLETMRSDVVNANLIADIFLGATVVSGAVATVLYLTRPVKARSPANAWTLVPMASGGRAPLGGVLLEGRF